MGYSSFNVKNVAQKLLTRYEIRVECSLVNLSLSIYYEWSSGAIIISTFSHKNVNEQISY